MKAIEKLTFDSVTIRTVSIPMRRPIVAKVGTYPEWPFILIDVKTTEGIVGRFGIAGGDGIANRFNGGTVGRTQAGIVQAARCGLASAFTRGGGVGHGFGFPYVFGEKP